MSLEDSVQRALTEHAHDVSAVPDVAALVARGTQARRRRRLAVVASVVATAVMGAIVVGPIAANRTEPAPVVATPSPAAPATASAGPRTGSGFFAGSANVPVSYAIPPGWEPLETFAVVRSSADPVFGVAFYDVANIYADGCRWVRLDPPAGPTVDDLVTAYRGVPELEATPARAVTVDGFRGKRLEFTVPDYDAADCRDASYALVQADNAGTDTGQEGAPNLWAFTPNQQNQVLVVDVDGTRLAIYVVHPPAISAQDRDDLDTILGSIRIAT